MITVKQELERAEERIELVEYRSAERASEIEEALDSYVTRVSVVSYTCRTARAKALIIQSGIKKLRLDCRLKVN